MPSARRQRYERILALTPIQAVEAWLTGNFGLGDEPALLQAIRKDPRVVLDDEMMIGAIAAAMDEGMTPEECLDVLATPNLREVINEPSSINRTVVIVRPKQPMIDWALQLPDASDVVPSADGEQTVYLVPSAECFEDDDELLAEFYEDIFREELMAWHRFEADWPANRDLKMFQEWFSIEIHSLVYDLCPEEPLEND